jgi:hypothetical protein
MPIPMNIQEIYKQYIEPLPAVERLQLVELIAHGLAAIVGGDVPHSRSLLELEGVGAEIWLGIDAQAYVDELRDEWDERA